MSTVALPRLVVLISGNGSNLQALIDAVGNATIAARIALVVSNKTKAFGLQRAASAAIPTLTKLLKPYKDSGKSRIDYDLDLAAEIKAALEQDSASQPDPLPSSSLPDLIVLAGFMHILSADFLAQFPAGRIINLHPALPGQFDGAHAIERALDSFRKGEIKHTGIMVHKVIAAVDRGETVLQQPIPIWETDTLDTLEERIHIAEHKLLVDGVIAMLSEVTHTSTVSL